jgi:hypothetical protein
MAHDHWILDCLYWREDLVRYLRYLRRLVRRGKP